MKMNHLATGRDDATSYCPKIACWNAMSSHVGVVSDIKWRIFDQLAQGSEMDEVILHKKKALLHIKVVWNNPKHLVHRKLKYLSSGIWIIFKHLKDSSWLIRRMNRHKRGGVRLHTPLKKHSWLIFPPGHSEEFPSQIRDLFFEKHVITLRSNCYMWLLHPNISQLVIVTSQPPKKNCLSTSRLSVSQMFLLGYPPIIRVVANEVFARNPRSPKNLKESWWLISR